MGTEKKKQVFMTDFDLERLKALIIEAKAKKGRDGKHLLELEGELGRAKVVASEEIPPDVITMNSRVALRDVDTGEDMLLTLVFPSDASMEEHKISVLAPIGTAMIGYRKGQVIQWEVPAGTRRLKVKSILYQPESAGDFDL